MQDWQAIESLRWVGLLSLAAILVSGIMPVLTTANNPSQSVSQTWASNRQSHLAISIMLTVFGAGFCASIVGWLIPTYHLWVGMYLVTLAGYVALLGVAWFPMADSPGEHSLRHPHFIGGAAAACGAIVGYASVLLAGGGIPRLGYYVTVVALIYSALWPSFFLRRVRKYFMVLEGILVVLFVAVAIALMLGPAD